MGEVIAVVATLTGVVLAVLAFWRDFADYRAKRYCERFKTLLEMSDVLAARGPYSGQNAVASAATAHENLLAEFDVEARANAVMYVKTAGRLKRPGSLTLALGWCVYGVFLFWFTVSGSIAVGAPADESAAVYSSVAQLIVMGIALISMGRGVLEGFRRWASRGIRLSVGLADELTVDWWRRAAAGVRGTRDGGTEGADPRVQVPEPATLQASGLL
jgi:hypothetical protein